MAGSRLLIPSVEIVLQEDVAAHPLACLEHPVQQEPGSEIRLRRRIMVGLRGARNFPVRSPPF